MILSMSSSRAVSIRIGTSEPWRMRLQTSIPSMSGGIRSRTTEAGRGDGPLADRGDVEAEALELERVAAGREQKAHVAPGVRHQVAGDPRGRAADLRSSQPHWVVLDDRQDSLVEVAEDDSGALD